MQITTALRATAAGGTADGVRDVVTRIDHELTALLADPDVCGGADIAAVADLLRTADRVKAAAVTLLGSVSHRGVLADEGLTPGTYLRIHGGRTAAEERGVCTLAERLTDMPTLARWYRNGTVSDGVVRDICWTVRNLTRQQRAWLDDVLAADPACAQALSADDLVGAVQRLADQARPDLHADRQRRAIQNRRVTLQPRLDGTGGQLHADLDAEGFDAVTTSLDSYHPTVRDGTAAGTHDAAQGAGGDGHGPAGDSVDDDEDGGAFGPRDTYRHGIARRRGEALVAMAHHRNADTCPANTTTCGCHRPSAGDGGTGGAGAGGTGDGDGGDAADPLQDSGGARCRDAGRPAPSRVGWAPSRATPSMLLLADIAALRDSDHPDHATVVLLTRTIGGPVELVPSAAERLLCDATLRLVFTDGHRTIGATAAHPKVSATLAAAVIARDAHCRFPACTAPAAVCDIHHLTPVHLEGATELDNLALICRQHHHAIHDGGWTSTRNPDDSITFARRGVRLSTQPHSRRRLTPHRPPPPGRPRRTSSRQPRTPDDPGTSDPPGAVRTGPALPF